jgi:WD40 repeat protein
VQLKGHSYDVEKIVFSDDGRWLVTATRDAYVLLWPLSSGTPAGEPLKLSTASDVGFAAFSKNSRWLAVGGYGKGVRLFDLAAPQIAASVRESTGKERAFRAAFSPDSRWLAVGGSGRTAQLWDLSLPDPEQSPIALTHEGAASTSDSILYVAFNSTSRLLLSAGTFGTGAGAHLWRLDTPDVPASRVSLQGIGRYATAAAFLGTDKVAVATLDGFGLWDVRGSPDKALPGKLVGHDGSVSGIFPDARGQWMITSASDSTPRFWNTGARQVGDPAGDTLPRRLSDETAHQRRVELSADGRWAVSETQDRRSVFAFASTAPDARFARRAIVSGAFLALSPDGRWLATSESRETSNNVWRTGLSLLELRLDNDRLKEGQLVGATEQKLDEEQRRGPPDRRVTAAAFGPNGKSVAAGRGDGLVTLWQVPVAANDKGRELRGHKDAIETIAFSRDGHWMATGGADTKVFLWDMTAANPAATARELSGHDGRVHRVSFSADGRWLFTGSRTKDDFGDGKHSAFLWELRQPGAAGIALAAHEGSVLAADISSDGRWLVTGGRGPLRLWDLAQKNPAARPTRLDAGNRGPVVNIGFTRNGQMLLARFESSALLWDVRRAGTELRPFVMGRGLGDIKWAGFSPDNAQLITGGYREGTLYAWDLTAEDPTVAPVALRGDGGGVFAGAISADSRVLVGAGNEGLKAWLLQPSDLVARACRVAGRNLTVPDWDVLVPGQAYHKTCADYPATER